MHIFHLIQLFFRLHLTILSNILKVFLGADKVSWYYWKFWPDITFLIFNSFLTQADGVKSALSKSLWILINIAIISKLPKLDKERFDWKKVPVGFGQYSRWVSFEWMDRQPLGVLMICVDDQPCLQPHHRFSLVLNIEMYSALPGCHTPEIHISLEYLQYPEIHIFLEYIQYPDIKFLLNISNILEFIFLFNISDRIWLSTFCFFTQPTPVTLEEIHLNQNILGCPVNTFQFEFEFKTWVWVWVWV